MSTWPTDVDDGVKDRPRAALSRSWACVDKRRCAGFHIGNCPRSECIESRTNERRPIEGHGIGDGL